MKYAKSVLKGFLATFIMGIGIALFIACELGSDPITVFLDGFNRVTGIPVSIIDQTINIIILILAIILNREKIGVNTIVCVLSLGICIQIPTMVIEVLHLASQHIIIRLIVMLIGQVCLTFSIAWMQTFADGINALDCVFFKIIERTNVKYRTIRIIYDGCFIISGFLLGGIVGIGTIVSLLTNGIMVEKFRILMDNFTRESERMVKENG